MVQDFESELTASRDEIAAMLGGVVDGITAGSIRLRGEDSPVVIEVPEELTLEIELETEDDEMSLELELEWPRTEIEDEASSNDIVEELPADDDAESPTDESSPMDEESRKGTDLVGEDDQPMPVEAADSSQTLARFELFPDQGDEWRWRLRHRNGNIIATSGEGYTQKHNALKGLRSVMQNAPEAEVTDVNEG